MSTLLDLTQTKVNYVVQEAIIIIKVKTRLLLFTSNFISCFIFVPVIVGSGSRSTSAFIELIKSCKISNQL